jgi:hypothetical protein
MRSRGGPAEIEFLGDGHEVAQLAQLHEVILVRHDLGSWPRKVTCYGCGVRR